MSTSDATRLFRTTSKHNPTMNKWYDTSSPIILSGEEIIARAIVMNNLNNGMSRGGGVDSDIRKQRAKQLKGEKRERRKVEKKRRKEKKKEDKRKKSLEAKRKKSIRSELKPLYKEHFKDTIKSEEVINPNSDEKDRLKREMGTLDKRFTTSTINIFEGFTVDKFYTESINALPNINKNIIKYILTTTISRETIKDTETELNNNKIIKYNTIEKLDTSKYINTTNFKVNPRDLEYIDLIDKINGIIADTRDNILNPKHNYIYNLIYLYTLDGPNTVDNGDALYIDSNKLLKKGTHSNNIAYYNIFNKCQQNFFNSVEGKDDLLKIINGNYNISRFCLGLECKHKWHKVNVDKLYRGDMNDWYNYIDNYEKYKEGGKKDINLVICQTNGLLSTSEDIEVTKFFLKEAEPEHKPIIVEYDCSKIKEHLWGSVKHLSRFSEEQEVILPIGTLFKITEIVDTSIYYNGIEIKHIRAQILPYDSQPVYKFWSNEQYTLNFQEDEFKGSVMSRYIPLLHENLYKEWKTTCTKLISSREIGSYRKKTRKHNRNKHHKKHGKKTRKRTRKRTRRHSSN